MSAGGGAADDPQAVADAILRFLAETDVYAARLQGARAIREAMPPLAGRTPCESAFEAALRAMAAAGLVDMAVEPYIPPRYLITPAGRARAASLPRPPGGADGCAGADEPPCPPGR